MKVSIALARAQLSRILEAAEGGEEVIITDRNEPKFQILPIRDRFALPPLENYERFLRELKPIAQKKKAASTADLVRDERDGKG